MNINFTFRLNTEDGEYAMNTDAATGQAVLAKVDMDEEEDLELEEKKEIKYVRGKPKTFTIITPALRHLPYPASAWPTITEDLDEMAADGTKVYVYTVLGGRETHLSFTSKAQREVVHTLMQSEMARRKANGEKKCLSVKALLNRFLASDH